MIGDFGLEKITEAELQKIMRRYDKLITARFAKAHKLMTDINGAAAYNGMTYKEAVAAEKAWRDESNKLGISFNYDSDAGELLGAWYGDMYFGYNFGDVDG